MTIQAKAFSAFVAAILAATGTDAFAQGPPGQNMSDTAARVSLQREDEGNDGKLGLLGLLGLAGLIGLKRRKGPQTGRNE